MFSRSRANRSFVCCAAAAVVFALAAAAGSSSSFAQSAQDRPPTSADQLRLEIDNLLEELHRLRAQLAEARLEADAAKRELAEMRQFIADHREYGPAFEQYRAVREAAEREARRQAAEAARERREAEQRERLARQRDARATREARRAELAEERRLREAGFTPIGVDVYIGQTSFYYGPVDAPVPYDPWSGFYAPPDTDTRRRVEFSSMTISGSLLNAAPTVRNIGVAVTFFDNRGNQVGHEIIQVNNARPNVPYPFTSRVTMALDRPFHSSSTYVLYADPVEE
jgi:multidrug efflux pump subunit AcrA (membrane-fusion protein)